ncbi:MAG: hypothetical protein HQK93_03875 [Nitrospirae bacterium]|nr:hypothetical protein [Nitrospirota bacterium]
MTQVLEKVKVSDLTIIEFKELIKETVLELIDPDYGLELRPEVETELIEARKTIGNGVYLTLEEVKKSLGI